MAPQRIGIELHWRCPASLILNGFIKGLDAAIGILAILRLDSAVTVDK